MCLERKWFVCTFGLPKGNLHKWLYTPRGCAILWVDPRHHDQIRPSTVSHEVFNPSFSLRYTQLGTRDNSQIYTVPECVAFWHEAGGIVSIPWHSRFYTFTLIHYPLKCMYYTNKHLALLFFIIIFYSCCKWWFWCWSCILIIFLSPLSNTGFSSFSSDSEIFFSIFIYFTQCAGIIFPL